MSEFFSVSPRMHIADCARSVAFYRDVLGFSVDAVFPEEAPTFALLSRGPVTLQIGGPHAVKHADQPPTVTLYFDVEDARAVLASVKDRVAIEWGPDVHFYGRREFAFRDPDGHLIIVSEETSDPMTVREG